jgi:hypothetical protein
VILETILGAGRGKRSDTDQLQFAMVPGFERRGGEQDLTPPRRTPQQCRRINPTLSFSGKSVGCSFWISGPWDAVLKSSNR